MAASPRACPLHSRHQSLSILGLMQQSNHSRSASLLGFGAGMVKEEQEERGEGRGRMVEGLKYAVEEKELAVADSSSPPVVRRARIETVDKMICAM